MLLVIAHTCAMPTIHQGLIVNAISGPGVHFLAGHTWGTGQAEIDLGCFHVGRRGWACEETQLHSFGILQGRELTL